MNKVSILLSVAWIELFIVRVDEGLIATARV